MAAPAIPPSPYGIDQTARLKLVADQIAMAANAIAGAPVTSTASMATLVTALKAGVCTVCFVGDSITEGRNQNWPSATWVRMAMRMWRTAFPEVTFTFVNLGLGGRIAANFASATYVGAANDSSPATSFYRPAVGSGLRYDVWHDPSLALVNGSVIGKNWRDHAIAVSPDLLYLMFGLNETSCLAYTTAMQSIITEVASGSAWAAKRPSIVLGVTHTGVANKGLRREIGRATRALATFNKLPLMDAGRVYDIMTLGADPAIYGVSGEVGYRYGGGLSSAAFALDPAYWLAAPGSDQGISPSGATLRATNSTNILQSLRMRAVADGRSVHRFASNTTNARPRLYWRWNPAHNYATGDCYYVEILGSTATAYSRVGGTAKAIGSVAVTAMSTSSIYFFDIEYTGSRHRISIFHGVGLTATIDVDDFDLFTEGWMGIGQATAGQGGVWSVGTDISNAGRFEFYDPMPVNPYPVPDALLMGAVNDFATNPDSVGGNTDTHPATLANTQIYGAVHNLYLRQVQIAVAR